LERSPRRQTWKGWEATHGHALAHTHAQTHGNLPCYEASADHAADDMEAFIDGGRGVRAWEARSYRGTQNETKMIPTARSPRRTVSHDSTIDLLHVVVKATARTRPNVENSCTGITFLRLYQEDDTHHAPNLIFRSIPRPFAFIHSLIHSFRFRFLGACIIDCNTRCIQVTHMKATPLTKKDRTIKGCGVEWRTESVWNVNELSPETQSIKKSRFTPPHPTRARQGNGEEHIRTGPHMISSR